MKKILSGIVTSIISGLVLAGYLYFFYDEKKTGVRVAPIQAWFDEKFPSMPPLLPARISAASLRSLHLGMTSNQVVAFLGAPSFSSRDGRNIALRVDGKMIPLEPMVFMTYRYVAGKGDGRSQYPDAIYISRDWVDLRLAFRESHLICVSVSSGGYNVYFKSDTSYSRDDDDPGQKDELDAFFKGYYKRIRSLPGAVSTPVKE